MWVCRRILSQRCGRRRDPAKGHADAGCPNRNGQRGVLAEDEVEAHAVGKVRQLPARGEAAWGAHLLLLKGTCGTIRLPHLHFFCSLHTQDATGLTFCPLLVVWFGSTVQIFV